MSKKKQRVNLNLAADVHGVLAAISSTAGRSQVGARGRRRPMSASRYVEHLVRERAAECELALAFLEQVGWHRSGIGTACRALEVEPGTVTTQDPLAMAQRVAETAQAEVAPETWAALAATVRDPACAGALYVLAREWALDNPRLRAELAVEAAPVLLAA